MPTTAAAVERPRRTQEERRAATRQALLEASLACLLEDGYTGLTTRRVAARAGVSPATQRFYFPTRSAFVAAAVEQLAIELRRQIGELPLRSAPPADRFRACLDELWRIANGPTFHVMTELSAAARGDENAREGFAAAERGVTRQIVLSARELFPDDMANPRFRLLIDLATSAMLGLAMFEPVVERVQLDQRWRMIRDELTHKYQELLDGRRG
jgi:AcrR family transcriptional regulator